MTAAAETRVAVSDYRRARQLSLYLGRCEYTNPRMIGERCTKWAGKHKEHSGFAPSGWHPDYAIKFDGTPNLPPIKGRSNYETRLLSEGKGMNKLPIEDEENFGRWCDEGGMYVTFHTKAGNLECRLYEVGGQEHREVAKFTLANFRVHQFWKWYNRVAPLPEAWTRAVGDAIDDAG